MLSINLLSTNTEDTSGADAMGHVGARAPYSYKWLDTGATVSRRTANKKLTKLY